MTTTNPAVSIGQGDWIIDPRSSKLGFAVKLLGMLTVRGVFRSYEGKLIVGSESRRGELSVDVASLDTANARRDTHLRSSDFFDAERFPTITFSAGSVSIEPSGSTVTGVLEIGEAIVSLQVPVEIEQRPAGCVRLTGSVDISLDSVGLGWNRLGVIGRTAKLHADLTLQQQL